LDFKQKGKTFTFFGIVFLAIKVKQKIIAMKKGGALLTIFLALAIAIAGINASAQSTYVPDDNFEQALIDLGYDTGTLNNWVTTASISGIATLDISGRAIIDLTGIEAFTSLTELNCQSNQLTKLDITRNTSLKKLYAESNPLTSIDLSKNTQLEILFIDSNQLLKLDVTNNIYLKILACGGNQLTTIDIKANTILEELHCWANPFTTIDVSSNPNLTNLSCWGTGLTTLDLKNNPALRNLDCSSNPLTNLDISNNLFLESIFCNSNQLTNLDVTKHLNLKFLNCSWNNLGNIDLTKNALLEDLRCNGDKLLDLNLNNNLMLKHLECSRNNLTSLDIRINASLEWLYCENNQLTNIDVTNKSKLQMFACGFNPLINLDFSTNINLIYVAAWYCKLTSINFKNHPKFQNLFCEGNELTSLDLSNMPNLYHLTCNNNKLNTLNIKNGNNEHLNWSSFNNNPDLTCIQVDDPLYANSRTDWSKDITVRYSSDCSVPEPPILSTTNVSNYTLTSGVSGGYIYNDGGAAITARGVCWSTTENPAITDNHTSDGKGLGEFTSSFSGLTARTIYHVRSYATNSSGTGYGNDVTFTTDVHFTPAWWPGNGMEHMNLYAMSATLDNTNLEPGDEIGVYDGNVCVGMGVITTVLDGSATYLAIRVSQDDPDSPGIDGYTSSHAITYKVWDKSAGTEVTYYEVSYLSGEGIFSPGSTAAFTLAATSTISQTISLTSGWNILSFAVMPADMTLKTILDPLVTSLTLVKVQDKKGNAIEKLPVIGWVDNIGQMKVTEGYKIKVNTAVTQSFIGLPISIPIDVSLDAGWNIMGYPLTSSQSSLTAFDALKTAGTLLKVQDEQGNAIEKLPVIGWIDNIKTLLAGKGYKVKTNAATTMTINNPAKGAVVIEEQEERIKTTHFSPAFSGNGLDQMNIYILNPTIDGEALKPGDEIGVFDGKTCVGAVAVDDPEKEYFIVIASADDQESPAADGFLQGNSMTVRLWDSRASAERSLKQADFNKGYNNIFEKSGTTIVKAGFERQANTKLNDAYPNPSSDKTTFTFGMEMSSEVILEIYDVKGNLVKVLVNSNLESGKHTILWNNRLENGKKAPSGLYLYKLKLDYFTQTKQLVIN
jgi:Leucine-rich repeat (LRR) protein